MPYLELNGEQIYYALHARDRSNGAPVLLIHGAGENHLVWPARLRRLDAAAVYTLDLPGHGKSGGAGRTSIQEYAAWVRSLLDAVRVEQIILVGHSMGGAIALLFGLLYPERAAGLVLIGAGARLRVAPRLLDLTKSDLAAAAEMIGQLEWSPHAPGHLIHLGRQQTLANRPEVIHGDYRACDAFDIVPQLGEITVPTLIITGAADQLTPVKYATFMADHLPSARLVIVPEAGHMVMIEAETAVAREVEAFVQDVTRERQ
jgi:pimeloyl-ACP methyl ester carboxylesterase